MELRATIFGAARAAAILSLVGCSTPSPKEAGSGGTAGGGATGGSGGANSGGTAGQGAGGSSGTGTAGTGGGSAGAPANVDCSAYTGNPAMPTFCNLKFVIQNVPCNSANCHGTGQPLGAQPLQFPLNDDAALMHTLETVISPDCGNIPIVTPGDPSKSALVKVLATSCSMTVPQMPYGCADTNTCMPTLYPAYQQAITDWIAAGAKLQ